MIKDGADTKEADLSMNGQILVGKFVDVERPTFLDAMNNHFSNVFKDKFTKYEGVDNE